MDVLKHKVGIYKRKFKINRMIKEIDDNMKIDVGQGNDIDDPKPETELGTFRISSTGNLDIGVRFIKNPGSYESPQSDFKRFGPEEEYQAIEICIKDPNAAAYIHEIGTYLREVERGYFTSCVDFIAEAMNKTDRYFLKLGEEVEFFPKESNNPYLRKEYL